jgi:hypothetical protein
MTRKRDAWNGRRVPRLTLWHSERRDGRRRSSEGRRQESAAEPHGSMVTIRSDKSHMPLCPGDLVPASSPSPGGAGGCGTTTTCKARIAQKDRVGQGAGSRPAATDDGWSGLGLAWPSTSTALPGCGRSVGGAHLRQVAGVRLNATPSTSVRVARMVRGQLWIVETWGHKRAGCGRGGPGVLMRRSLEAPRHGGDEPGVLVRDHEAYPTKVPGP